MERQKILVADPTEEFRDGMAQMLASAYDVRTCQDGLTACGSLDRFQPDLMVLDLALPGLDGLGVLKAAATCIHRPAILVTTRFISPYIEWAVQELGVDYVMLKPCDLEAVVDRIGDLIGADAHVASKTMGPERAVSDMLLMLGVSVRHDGFRYLETAVMLYAQDPMQSVTKSLYPAVAERHGSTPASVERGIRTAIAAAWSRRDEGVWKCYLTTGRSGLVPRPTNTEFIAHLAQRLRTELSRTADAC